MVPTCLASRQAGATGRGQRPDPPPFASPAPPMSPDPHARSQIIEGVAGRGTATAG